MSKHLRGVALRIPQEGVATLTLALWLGVLMDWISQVEDI